MFFISAFFVWMLDFLTGLLIFLSFLSNILSFCPLVFISWEAISFNRFTSFYAYHVLNFQGSFFLNTSFPLSCNIPLWDICGNFGD